MKVSVSIVLYENDPNELKAVVNSCLQSTLINIIYLIDNSKTPALATLVEHPRISYLHNKKNVGFGAAHNIAIKRVSAESTYHLVLNPDVTFGAGVIEGLNDFMNHHSDIGLVMPKVLYKNGNLQRLCKLLPSPMDLFGRRFAPRSGWVKRMSANYELDDFNYDRVMDIPNLSGCFMFLRVECLKRVGCFDERYFMYLEDIDLVRRIGDVSRTVFYPYEYIYHDYEKGSYQVKKLLWIHIVSAIKYFNKWGWIWDKKRRDRNKKLLSELNRTGF